MSKFLTAPQWYDAGGGLNKSLDVNCNGYDTATAFGNGANAVSNGVAVGKGANAVSNGVAVGKGANVVSNGNFSVSGVAVGKGANTNETVSSFGSVAIGESANATNDSVAVGRIAKANVYGVAVGKGAKAVNNNGCVAIGRDADANGTTEDCIAIGLNAKCVVDSGPYRRIQFLNRTGTNTYINANSIGFGSRSLLDLIYPVGSIYISVSSTDPGTIFGGTWEAFATGKTLVGVDAADTDFNASGKEGGSKTVTLTTDQIPAHQHYFEQNIRGLATNVKLTQTTNQGSPEKNVVKAETGATMSVPERSRWSENYDGGDFRTTNTGGNEPHNNMPPYITVYMWKRTA